MTIVVGRAEGGSADGRDGDARCCFLAIRFVGPGLGPGGGCGSGCGPGIGRGTGGFGGGGGFPEFVRGLSMQASMPCLRWDTMSGRCLGGVR